jgi:hypothetical protein
VADTSASPSIAAAGRWLLLPFPLALPACHADAEGGIGFPNTFFSETFPLTCAFCLGTAVGSSGKSELDNFGGAFFGTIVPDPGLDARGSGTTVMDWFVLGPLLLGKAEGGRKPDEALADQGVVRWVCRKAGVAGAADGFTAGRVRGADELAAWATRSQTCRDDC